MPFWVFGATNPFITIIYAVISEVVLKIISVTQHRHWKMRLKWRLLLYVVLVMISTAIHYRVLFTNDYHKSLVDASNIANLNSEQINRLEDVLEGIEEYDFIKKCDIKELPDHPYLSKTCDIIWYENKPNGALSVRYDGLDINIAFYIDEQDAIKAFKLYIEGRYTLVSNENNTEAILFDSEMDRAGHAVPIPNRRLLSKLRLGNAIITLSENPLQNQLHMNTSSDFIRLLCDLLTQ